MSRSTSRNDTGVDSPIEVIKRRKKVAFLRFYS